jgi:uncharacterized protein (DUF2132 family)
MIDRLGEPVASLSLAFLIRTKWEKEKLSFYHFIYLAARLKIVHTVT